MPPAGLEVDDRAIAVAREVPHQVILAFHGPVGALGEGAHGDRVGVTAQHARRLDYVLDRGSVHYRARLRFQSPTPLAGLEDQRMAAVQEHRGLHTAAGAQARVEKHHRQHLALQTARDLAALDARGESQQGFQRFRPPVLERKEVAARYRSTAARPSSSRAASTSEKVSGGIRRRTEGSLAVPVRMRWGGANSACWTGAAGRPSWSPSSRPRPVTRGTPSASAP